MFARRRWIPAKLFWSTWAKETQGRQLGVHGFHACDQIPAGCHEQNRYSEKERKDFFLYVDEFQNFATESFCDYSVEARKYRLSLTLANQYIGQLLIGDKSTVLQDAIFGNVGSMVSFGLVPMMLKFWLCSWKRWYSPKTFSVCPSITPTCA